MAAKILSSTVLGADAYLVEVEVDIALGFPQRRITVNLAPADIRKEGSAFDLPISLGKLSA